MGKKCLYPIDKFGGVFGGEKTEIRKWGNQVGRRQAKICEICLKRRGDLIMLFVISDMNYN
jgi:hypothetical protein